MLFDVFGLDRRLLRAVDTLEWLEATPIQAESIPHALEGQDVLACARTGSGKTGAFVLPVMHRLLSGEERTGRGPQVLILCPTRELAMQVGDQMKELGRYTRLSSACIVGGEAYPPQIRAMEEGLDLLVGTPGRLIDHLRSGKLVLDGVNTLVLDEADRMLDMGFIDDVMRLARACPEERQTLFFSATLDGPVFSVATRLVNDPVRVEVDSSDALHADIEEIVLRADSEGHKQELLLHLCRDPELTRALVFVGTKSRADDESQNLRSAGYDVVALHGDLPQSKRTRVVERLRDGRVRIVVATDVAARGLDIEGVTHVVNYDLPRTPREYVHRIGRTGRAGAQGVAVSLVAPADWIRLADIEKFRGESLTRMVIPGKEPTRAAPQGSAATTGSTGRRRYGRRGGVRRRQEGAASTESDDA